MMRFKRRAPKFGNFAPSLSIIKCRIAEFKHDSKIIFEEDRPDRSN